MREEHLVADHAELVCLVEAAEIAVPGKEGLCGRIGVEIEPELQSTVTVPGGKANRWGLNVGVDAIEAEGLSGFPRREGRPALQCAGIA